MRRWIFEASIGTLRIHNIRQSDEARAHHDHPWDFTTLILWGSYFEVTPAPAHPAGWIRDFEDNEQAFEGWMRSRSLFCHAPSVMFRGEVVTFWPWLSRRSVTAESLHRLILLAPVWTFVVSGPRRRGWGFQVPGKGWIFWRKAQELWADAAWSDRPDFCDPNARRLREARETLGLTMGQASRAIGVSVSTWSGWESERLLLHGYEVDRLIKQITLATHAQAQL